MLHLVAGVAGAAQKFLSAGIQQRSVAFQEHFGKPANASQRRSQVVRDGVTKSFQLSGRGLQLCGLLCQFTLELILEMKQFALGGLLARDVYGDSDAAERASLAGRSNAASNQQPPRRG